MSEFKIIGYDPFFIGVKLKPGIKINSLEKKMRSVLLNKDEYETPPPVPDTPVKFGPPIELLGIKNNAELKLNIERHSFNINGEIPENVINIFQELPDLLKAASYSVPDTINFYEVKASLIVETGKNPREIINKSVDVNMSDAFDLEMCITGFKANSRIRGEELIELVMEPRAGNPNNHYFINILYRSNDVSKIFEFAQALPGKVEKLFDSLEEN